LEALKPTRGRVQQQRHPAPTADGATVSAQTLQQSLAELPFFGGRSLLDGAFNDFEKFGS
jgi:hypothetical protein